MGKPRTKRQLVREERKQKRKAAEAANAEAERHTKRRRPENDHDSHADEPDAKRHNDGNHHGFQVPETEFFGMLPDEEQEYFRRADELLELNQFPSDEERDVFLQNIYREAVGKELKLASSQSLSRLMERLILLSTTAQKKRIFAAFAGHFLSLVQHRFASHCCETLFLQSAPVVTQELGKDTRFVVDTKGAGTKNGDGEEGEGEEGGDGDEEPQQSMENLFLLTLDEFEEHLGYLMTDKFASHTLRVLLVVLSGKPLDDRSTKSLIKSKNKENITVQGLTPGDGDELNTQLRAVPGSFTMAVKKIITDATAGMDYTALRVLVKHPTGNPLLQLLLELDISLNHKKTQKGAEPPKDTLLHRLLPGAPASLNDADSEASDFVNGMMYEQIGSRLLETLITHAPGKIFKALHLNFFAPRIATYVRNDIASYPAIRALNRFSKDDLVDAIQKIIPVIPALVSKGRFNVIKTLYERSKARAADDQMRPITTALINALEADTKDLIPKLCQLGAPDQDAEEAGKPPFQQDRQNKQAMASHGAHLVATMLATPVAPAKAAQTSLLALSADQLHDLATRTPASAGILTAALAHPALQNPIFHKTLVANLIPRIADLADSQPGHVVVNAIVAVPSRGKDRAVPFHMKQNIIGKLAERERDLRDSWTGRKVWRTWKGDMWKSRPADWARWAKEVDGEVEAKPKPWELLREKQQQKQHQKEKGQDSATAVKEK
ncbi:hypothetical protein ACRALDRAFT_1083717 [Sodiomyces alcalophilus JCM 7366]|uniref:uncharacterized protein n=1 Tax=Sodiomyces alcalophilus JCM 7366 TaxID=591952 RepID=UPI0039B52559